MSPRFSRLAAFVVAVLLTLACGDGSPTGVRSPQSPRMEINAPSQQTVQDQIDLLFPEGGLRNAATSHLNNIARDLENEKIDNARKKAFALVNFIRRKQADGQLLDPNGPNEAPTTAEAADVLVSSLYLFVGLTPTGVPPDALDVDAAIGVVGPEGGTIRTGGDAPNGAVSFPAGVLPQFVTVTIERLPDPGPTTSYPIPYKQYAIAFDVSISPVVPLNGTATVAVCTVEEGNPGTAPDPDRLVLGHVTGPETFEILPEGSSPEPLPSLCDDARLLASLGERPAGGLRLALWEARRMGQRALHALAPTSAYAGHGGLLGQTTTFSAFVPTDTFSVASVSVSPSPWTLPVGGTVQMADTARNRNGTNVTSRHPAAEWVSSDVAVATVSTTGLVTAVGAGMTTITATVDGVSGSAQVTVTAPTGPPSITSLELASTTLTIGGASTSFTTVLSNPGATTSGVFLQGYVVQSPAERAAGGTTIQCTDTNGELPTGSCTESFSVRASNTGAGTGTLVAGAASYRLELRRQTEGGYEVLDTESVPVTLLSDPTANAVSMQQGSTTQLPADGIASWSSSDPSQVIVSPTGLVTSIGTGPATIASRSATGAPLTTWSVNAPSFSNFPRETLLAWPAVAGATMYLYTIDYCEVWTLPDYASSCTTNESWRQHILGQGPPPANAGIVFVGVNPGRWKVQAYGEGGIPIGAESGYTYFRYTN